MLMELRIRNFAIIDDLRLEFGPGLNILTGETGAGKSIIIDAVGLLLGDRAAAEWVRSGADLASIEAAFVLPADAERAAAVKTLLESESLDDPDAPQWVNLSREVRRNGRNICRINGRSVSLQMLAEVAGLLVDVHGQGEHLGLLQPKTHIHLLDRYGALLPLRAQVAERVAELRRVRSELQKLRQDARTIAQRLDMLSFQVEEIAAAALRPGEDGELESERRRLGNAEALTSLAQTAAAILSQGDGELPGAIDMVSEAVGRLEKLARIDPDMTPHADEGQALIEQLSDLARTLQDYADALEFNPVRLAEVEERLELIANLKRKYGDTIEQINAFGARARRELEELSNWDAKTADLEQQEERLLRIVGKLSAELSQQRQAAGETLARQVEQELADLKMVRARFGVAIVQTEHPEGAYLPDGRRVAFDSTGVDQVEFLISANPGEPLKPMARVASGGETARLMLALKSTLAHADATPTLIFDEIDQGIGGRVGAIVGQKLWRLTGVAPGQNGDGVTSHQVLCITHLPQLAAFGDHHYTVSKQILTQGDVERTHTVVRTLAAEERIAELTQMLGAHSEAGRRSVEEMLGEVAQVKCGALVLS
ncbi:MAG TPA: DNA repair protein RecN [Chloroflexi bacterium]|nr:DNA repair protein RecN [Chloroflexota bacterium]HHW89190.1 DNA repair protein RecN [Chloroflexota bacterium]